MIFLLLPNLINLEEFHDKLEQLKNIKTMSKNLKQKNFVYHNAFDLHSNLLADYEH